MLYESKVFHETLSPTLLVCGNPSPLPPQMAPVIHQLCASGAVGVLLQPLCSTKVDGFSFALPVLEAPGVNTRMGALLRTHHLHPADQDASSQGWGVSGKRKGRGSGSRHRGGQSSLQPRDRSRRLDPWKDSMAVSAVERESRQATTHTVADMATIRPEDLALIDLNPL